MVAAATPPVPPAPFKDSRRTRPSRRALLATAAAASWIWQASPASAQSAPKVRIITGNGDFLVDLRPHVAHPAAPPAGQQPAAEQAPVASPPAALAATSTSLPTPPPAPAPVISPAPATETAMSAAQPAQDTPAITAPSAAPAAVAAAVAAAAPPASTASGAQAVDSVEAAVRSWAEAWAGKNLNAYFASYGQGFAPADGQARQPWETSRRTRIVGKSRISVKLSDFSVAVQGSLATARFQQHYSAGALNISSRKMLTLAQEANERWVIIKETTGH